MLKIKIPLKLDLFLLRLRRLRKAVGLLFFIGLALVFLFYMVKTVNREFPSYEKLEKKTGYFEKCWEFSRGGKFPSRFLAVQLEKNVFFSLQGMRGQYDFSILCKELERNKKTSITVFFEAQHYEHQWNSFFIHPKEDGILWALQQGDAELVDYNRQLSMREADKEAVVIILFFLSALTVSFSAWGIKEVMYPGKKKKKVKNLS
jgi:hypothetical protein